MLIQNNHLDYLAIFDNYVELLSQSYDFISIDKSDMGESTSGQIDCTEKMQNRISPKILDYYKLITFHENIWTLKKNNEVRGFINIIPLEDSLADEFLKDFRMLDSFVSEACVGFYLSDGIEPPDDELYFLYFEDEPQGLNVDMEGYIQLLYMTRGFQYWQESLLWLQGNPEGTKSSVEEFRKYMPQVFPDFKWEEFVALYEKVKLK